MYTCNCRNIE